MVKAQVCEGNLTKDYTFAYDANGNMTAECFRRQAEVTYQYDAENRLTAVYDQQKLLMASTYDGDGNRAFQLNYNPAAVCGYGIGWGDEIYMPEHSQNEDESLTAEGLLFSYVCSDTGRAYDLTEYVNDTNREYTEVLTAYTINGGATESYSYAGNKRLSRNNIWTEARDVVPNEISYYLYDRRGSVTANTWYNGMVTDVFQYDPYGQVTLGSTEHADFYGYNGESYNPNTGLEFPRARYYNADMGRFFQEDSYLGKIAEPLTLNRYAYGKNSPMNYADPSGYYSTIEGTDAHETLFAYLRSKHSEDVFTDYKIDNYEYSETGEGKIDIVYFGKSGVEIYELKTVFEPFYRYVTGLFDRPTGPEQRQGYINAWRAKYPKMTVNEEGKTLNSELMGLELTSKKYSNKKIVYVMDSIHTGMVHWYYKGDDSATRLAGKIKTAKENGKETSYEKSSTK